MTNVEVVRRFIEAFGRGDAETQLALMAPHIELHEWPDTPDGVRRVLISRIQLFTTEEPALTAAGLETSDAE